MIPYLRIYDSSIFNYIKYQVLPLEFTETRVNEPLYSTANGYITKSQMPAPEPTSEGRGWVVFNEGIVSGRPVVDMSGEQTSKITVNGASSYTIDYINGKVLNPNTTPTSISYSWYYVSFIQGWPGEKPPPLPVVALDLDSTLKSGFQLGGGSKDTIEGSFYVFATSDKEKKDITDLIYQSVYNRTLPIRNWHEGSYLDYNGTHTGFTPTTVSGLTSGAFTNVSVSLSGPRMDWSELNRHRTRIRFTFEVLRDD